MNGFLGSRILEAAIGLSLYYVLLALFCTTANEWLAALLNARAGMLRQALLQMLGRQKFGTGTLHDSFYEHPLVAGLQIGGGHPPYLPAHCFSRALLDLVARESSEPLTAPATFASIGEGVARLAPGPVRTALLALLGNTEGELRLFEENVETWFNDAMASASARYRRRVQIVTLCGGAVLVVLLNADSIELIGKLIDGRPALLQGWTSAPRHAGEWVLRVAGWLLTLGAIALGAPFWFDVLSRFVNLRPGRRVEACTSRNESRAPARLQDLKG